jgi:Secretion system C-terminal sorting domain
MNHELHKRLLRLRTLLLVAFGFFIYSTTHAQFTTATPDGVIAANEYGVHANGQNQQTDGGTTYSMCWDATNLYVAFTGSNFNEAAVLYLDYNPIRPVNGGTNANGSVQGLYTYDRNHMMLPFRGDFVLYFKNGYNEYRRADGAGYWGGNTAFALATGNNGGTNTCEIAIPWNTITAGAGRPAAFNWLTYKGYDYGPGTNGIYASVPAGNPNCGCNQDPSRLYPTRYYNVLNTANGSATPPFSTTSFTYYENNFAAGTGGYYLNNGTFYDLTINDNAVDNTDNDPAFHLYDNNEISNRVLLDANVSITHDLYVAQGSALLPANNAPTAVNATLTFSGANGSIYNFGRIDPNPEAANAGDWNNRRINFVFTGATTRLQPTNLFKDRWRMSNVTVNAGASLLGPLTDSLVVELQWGTLNNQGTIDLGGTGTTAFADLGTRGDWSQHNDYNFSGSGTWRIAGLLIGRNSSRLQPVPGSTVRLLVQHNFENYDEFIAKNGTGRIDVVMAGRIRQWIVGNTTETTGATTTFHNLEIDNANLAGNYNNTADVWFDSFGGGQINYFLTGNLLMRNGDLITRNRGNGIVHRLTLRDTATTTLTFVHSNINVVGSSFVDGPISWEVEQSIPVTRGFPVGKTKTVSGTAIGDARPVALQVDHDLSTRTTYTSEMFLDDRSSTYAWPSPIPEVIAWISQQRYWNITKGPGANVQSAQVTLSYDITQRVDGVTNAPALRIVKDNGAGQWLNITPLGPGGSASNTGFITSFPFTSFSDFTLASVDVNMLLPVDLLSFEARLVDDIVQLDWRTAREVNTDLYVVEASNNRAQFHPVGQLPAAGNSELPLSYQFIDMHPALTEPVLYYRIKILDKNGDATYSEVRSVTVTDQSRPQLFAYPNPASMHVTLELVGSNDLKVSQLVVSDVLGRQLSQVEWVSGLGRSYLDVSTWANGTYFVTLRTDHGPLITKIVVRH